MGPPLPARRARPLICGPLDEPDPEVNSDPDSLLGEDDEAGFDELAGDHPEESGLDDGFDDAGGDDEEDDADDDLDPDEADE